MLDKIYTYTANNKVYMGSPVVPQNTKTSGLL